MSIIYTQLLILNFAQVFKQVTTLPNLTKLNLHSNKLQNLPHEIGKLQNLKDLDLSINELHSLPQEIGKLQKLEVLFLTGNNF